MSPYTKIAIICLAIVAPISLHVVVQRVTDTEEVSDETSFFGAADRLLADKASDEHISSVSALIVAQENYRKSAGKYLAIIDGESLDPSKDGRAADYLGKGLPAGFSVVEYETWDGQVGFDIQYDDGTYIHSYGVLGPQKEERTWSMLAPTTSPSGKKLR